MVPLVKLKCLCGKRLVSLTFFIITEFVIIFHVCKTAIPVMARPISSTQWCGGYGIDFWNFWFIIGAKNDTVHHFPLTIGYVTHRMNCLKKCVIFDFDLYRINILVIFWEMCDNILVKNLTNCFSYLGDYKS